MKGDEMIRITYLKGKNSVRSKAFTTNPFLHLLFLSIIFVISARFNPNFGAHSELLVSGFAAALALPAATYYFVKSIRELFAARNDAQNETVSMADFVNAHPCPENF